MKSLIFPFISDNILDIEDSRRKDADRWWTIKMFSYKDESESLEISIFGFQLYILLFYAIIEDFYNICYLFMEIWWTVFNLLRSIIFYLLSQLANYITFVTVLFILVLIAYFLLIQSSKKNYKRNSETDICANRKLVKEKSCDRDLDSSVNYGCGSRKYLKIMIKVLFVAAVLTLPWEFVRLYQSAVAEKMALMSAVSIFLCHYVNHCW